MFEFARLRNLLQVSTKAHVLDIIVIALFLFEVIIRVALYGRKCLWVSNRLLIKVPRPEMVARVQLLQNCCKHVGIATWMFYSAVRIKVGVTNTFVHPQVLTVGVDDLDVRGIGFSDFVNIKVSQQNFIIFFKKRSCE